MSTINKIILVYLLLIIQSYSNASSTTFQSNSFKDLNKDFRSNYYSKILTNVLKETDVNNNFYNDAMIIGQLENSDDMSEQDDKCMNALTDCAKSSYGFSAIPGAAIATFVDCVAETSGLGLLGCAAIGYVISIVTNLWSCCMSYSSCENAPPKNKKK